jgi:hypothetical protein
MAADLWTVTAYFNPCHYGTKKANFDRFAARLATIGARLLIVELALEDDSFELTDHDDVIRLRGRDVLWQKERLLNIAIAALPASCTKVAWLDCDVLFEDDDWLNKTSAALDRVAIVQPFSSGVSLRRGRVQCHGDHDAESVTESFASVCARDRSLAHAAPYGMHGHTGYAWAAQRKLLDACGLYDACLSGGGDHLMAHAFAGTLDSPCIPSMLGANRQYATHFMRWAGAINRVSGGRLGYLHGRLLHLWHGAAGDRRYFWRNQELKAFGFDPDRHIRRGANGLWEWADAPDAMRAWARDAFVSRNEDGQQALNDAEDAAPTTDVGA